MDGGSMQAGLTALLTAGALSLGDAAIGLADPNSDDPESVTDYAAVVMLSAALLSAASALVFLRRHHAGGSRRAGNLGLVVAAGGATLAGVGNRIEDGLGVSAFGLLFAVGGLALVLGLLVAGVSALTTLAASGEHCSVAWTEQPAHRGSVPTNPGAVPAPVPAGGSRSVLKAGRSTMRRAEI